ncbi:MAG: energy transducer TonB [Bacteroidales bacterium]|nr:energy transducer TonB [Bacteroidales bacterium]
MKKTTTSLLSIVFLFAMLFVFTSNVNAQVDKSEKDSEKVFTVVDKEAVYPGGVEAMNNFLAQNILYPTFAKQKNVQGKVIISFIVERNGSISNIKIVKDIGEGCGEEGMRIVKLMPKWKPAQQKGEPVRQQFVLPISFHLTNK